jgi:hypothetical protein
MTNSDPDVLFHALQYAINHSLTGVGAMGIRASVKEYLGVGNIRLSDKVLLDCMRRRLDNSPLNIPADRKEEISLEVVTKFGDQFNDIFKGHEDIFKI